MSINYEEIGKFAVEKANEYENSLIAHKEIKSDQATLDKEISVAEVRGEKERLEKLYEKYRELKRDESANDSFRQKFCDDFLFELSLMAKEEDEE